MTKAVGFISENCRSLIRCRVSGVSCGCSETKSASRSRLSKAAIAGVERLFLVRVEPARIGIDDLHVEAERAPRHRLADAAEADQASVLPVTADAGQVIGLRAGIDALAEQPVAERDVAGDRQQQAEADVGGGIGDDRRNVGDRNAELASPSARSMRSCVMFIDDTALSLGLAASTSRSTVSCSSDSRMSQRFTASISLALSSTRLELGLISTSATARSRFSALSAIGWVTKTRGLLTIRYS